MNKETEELLIIGVVVIVLISVLTSNSGSASALGLAKIQASTNATYANDAASVISSLGQDFGSSD